MKIGGAFTKLGPNRLRNGAYPFVSLNTRPLGEALTVEKMKKCVWVETALVVQLEFLEWTDADHLRHSKFVGLREDKDPGDVVRESCHET
jgi:ATP-dependent DNA ligase